MTRLRIVAALAAALTFGQYAAAQGYHEPCGTGDCCGPVCRLVEGIAEVKVYCYGCKCDEICLPGPSKCCDKNVDCGCPCNGPCTCQQRPDCTFCWKHWVPGCATPKTRTKLVKYVVIKKVPTYKWVIEKGPGCGVAVPPPGAGGPTPAVPMPPNPQARLKSQPVVVPAGTVLPPLPKGIQPSQVRGVVFSDPLPATDQSAADKETARDIANPIRLFLK